MKKSRHIKAQLTVEFIIVFTVVTVVVMTVALKQDSFFQQAYTNTLQERAKSMEATSFSLDAYNGFEPSLNP